MPTSNRLLLERPLICFDLETTDFLPEGRIISMSFVKVFPPSHPSTTATFEVFGSANLRASDGSVYVKPPVKSCPGALAKHCIQDYEVDHLPPFSAHAQSLHTFLKGCDLTGYNIRDFDIKVLTLQFSECTINWKPDEDIKIVDTMVIYQDFLREANQASQRRANQSSQRANRSSRTRGNRGSQRRPNQASQSIPSGTTQQDAYLKFIGRKMQGAHNAEADTIGALELLFAMVRWEDLKAKVEQILRR